MTCVYDAGTVLTADETVNAAGHPAASAITYRRRSAPRRGDYVRRRPDRLTASVTGGVEAAHAHDDLGRRISETADSVTKAYTYDGNGQRTSATVTAGGTTTTTDYAYDGITLLSLDAVRSDETTYAVAYLYDEDGRPYAGVYQAGTSTPVTFLIATTDRGDVVALTNTAGDVFARYTYDPYGAVLSQDANATTGITPDEAAAIADRQPLRYAGYAYDAHSATYYLSQRHYDPATMRFLTKDPARDDGEESAYQYCAGDPVGNVDPTGLYRETLWREWIPGYRIKSWISRQVLYWLVGARLARGAYSLLRRSFGSRVVAIPSARYGRAVVGNSFGALASIPSRVDRSVAQFTNFHAKHLEGWQVWRPSVMLWIYRETTERMTYFEVSTWTTRRAFSERSGYHRRWGTRAALASDDRIISLAKTWGYIRNAR